MSDIESGGDADTLRDSVVGVDVGECVTEGVELGDGGIGQVVDAVDYTVEDGAEVGREVEAEGFDNIDAGVERAGKAVHERAFRWAGVGMCPEVRMPKREGPRDGSIRQGAGMLRTRGQERVSCM